MSRGVRREIAARRLAREFALQAVYQWLLHALPAGETPAPTDLPLIGQAHQTQLPQLHTIEELLASAVPEGSPPKPGSRTSPDAEFFTALLQGAVREAPETREIIEPLLTRAITELSPVEHAILLLSVFELRHDTGTPYRVVINEAIELAKKYGGTDGHKFINGVLDRLAASLRPEEVAFIRAQEPGN